MSFPNDQLFLTRFIAFNKNRYSAQPDLVEKFEGLTLQTVMFTNFRKVDIGEGVMAHIVDVESTVDMRGIDQQYLPADYVKNGPAELEESVPVERPDLERKGIQGIYFLGVSAEESVGAVLTYNGKKTIENIKSIVKEKCYFELTDADIVVSEDLTVVTIDSRTITGILQVVEGLYDDQPRFNGQFRFDGTVRAL